VISKEEQPLNPAWSTALGASLSNGIVLLEVDLTTYANCVPNLVQKSNTFEAGAKIWVDADAWGPVPIPCEFGVAFGIDALIAGVENVQFNYNNMPGTLLSSAEGPTEAFDWGMLVIPCGLSLSSISSQQASDASWFMVDARYNYWGNPNLYPKHSKPWDPRDFDPDIASMLNLTGPGGQGLGNGQAIYALEPCVVFMPWLTVNHEWCLDSHVGKFCIAISYQKCWNTFSVPIALDSSIGDWAAFEAINPNFSADIGPIVRYDPTVPGWVVVNGTDPAPQPLQGYKVYISAATFVFLPVSTGDSMPSELLDTGWNLVGPNPPFYNWGIDARDFVSSVVRTDGTGFSQVVSQGGSQPNWVYTLGDWIANNRHNNPTLLSGKAYWVWVNSDVTLAGFGFTPLALFP